MTRVMRGPRLIQFVVISIFFLKSCHFQLTQYPMMKSKKKKEVKLERPANQVNQSNL